jgi:hypothetical protein
MIAPREKPNVRIVEVNLEALKAASQVILEKQVSNTVVETTIRVNL